MSKKSRRRKKRSRMSVKPPLLWGIIGSVLLVMIVLFLSQNQSQSDQVVLSNERPSWQAIPLTDARTGETFTLADFDNKNVFVKIMSPF